MNELKEFIEIKFLILRILYAHPEVPVFSRKVLLYETYILMNELFSQEIIITKDSFDEAFNELYYGDLIDRRGRKNSITEAIFITEDGKKEKHRFWDLISKEIQEQIKEKRRSLDELGKEGLENYLQQNEIKIEGIKYTKIWKPIKWGKS